MARAPTGLEPVSGGGAWRHPSGAIIVRRHARAWILHLDGRYSSIIYRSLAAATEALDSGEVDWQSEAPAPRGPGRRTIGPAPLVQITAHVTPQQREFVEHSLGGGDLSAGVRRAVRLARLVYSGAMEELSSKNTDLEQSSQNDD